MDSTQLKANFWGKDFSKLYEKTEDELIELGMARWNQRDDPEENHFNGGVLFLFPYDIYDMIPDGFEVTVISGRKERFKKGVTDNDRRMGYLAYGIVKP